MTNRKDFDELWEEAKEKTSTEQSFLEEDEDE